MLPNLEDRLYNWVIEHRNQDHRVSGNMIRLRALQLLSEDPTIHMSFQGSEGWFHRCLRRINLVMRRFTTSGRELPKMLAALLTIFLKHPSPIL